MTEFSWCAICMRRLLGSIQRLLCSNEKTWSVASLKPLLQLNRPGDLSVDWRHCTWWLHNAIGTGVLQLASPVTYFALWTSMAHSRCWEMGQRSTALWRRLQRVEPLRLSLQAIKWMCHQNSLTNYTARLLHVQCHVLQHLSRWCCTYKYWAWHRILLLQYLMLVLVLVQQRDLVHRTNHGRAWPLFLIDRAIRRYVYRGGVQSAGSNWLMK